jgi:hypothetical protein
VGDDDCVTLLGDLVDDFANEGAVLLTNRRDDRDARRVEIECDRRGDEILGDRPGSGAKLGVESEARDEPSSAL